MRKTIEKLWLFPLVLALAVMLLFAAVLIGLFPMPYYLGLIIPYFVVGNFGIIAYVAVRHRKQLLKALPLAVWKAWKNPEHLVKWWAPAPYETVSTKHEFFSGGGFGTMMKTADGTEIFNAEACFLEIVENKRIVWTSALKGEWRPNKDDMPFTAFITLEEHPDGTKYTATALHQNDEDRQKHADMGFVDGWGTCIEQLGKLAEHYEQEQ